MQENPTQGSDEWLEAALRADAGNHAASYVTDDGFTARVLERLPQPAALPVWRRPVVALLWVIAGSAAAAALPELFYDVFRGLVATLFGQPLTLSRIAVAVAVLGAFTWSTLLYALREE